jgi:hypothetical protein
VNLNPGPTAPTLTERQWDRDMPAYAALRSQGLQPHDIDGCAELQARATIPWEIETGRVLPKHQVPIYRSLLADLET